MSAQRSNYVIGTQVPRNKYDLAQGKAVEGVDISVFDVQTGNTLSVFVPRTQYSPAQVQTLIEAELAIERGVHALTQ